MTISSVGGPTEHQDLWGALPGDNYDERHQKIS
jgi:hypothetical protein